MIRVIPYLRWIDLVDKVRRKYYLYGHRKAFNPLFEYTLIMDILKGDYEFEGI